MTEFQKNVWKYSTAGLLAILVVGFSFPQALGDIQNNVNHMLNHIYNFTDGIEAKTNNLPSDPASNTVVNTRASQSSVNDIKTQTDKMLGLRELHDSSFDVTTANPFAFRFFCDDTYVLHSFSYSTSRDAAADDWNAPQLKRGGHSLGLHGLSLADAPAGDAPFEVVPINAGLDEFGTGVFEITLSKSADGGDPDSAQVGVVVTVASDAECEVES